MNDQDYIRKAVELADGGEWTEQNNIRTPDGVCYYLHDGTFATECLDALAAQLVRQVDVMVEPEIVQRWCGVDINMRNEIGASYTVASSSIENDRTMNTIKTIVDGKVLD